MSVCGITRPLGRLSPTLRQVAHVLRTRSPVALAGPLDLHVLSTPPAFVLSQDQTLQESEIALPNATIEYDPMIASGITEFVFVSLPAAHASSRSTRATARFSHNRLSISEFVVPPRLGGTRRIARQM